LEKFPYKVGDKVNIYVQNDDIEGWFDIEVAEITSMRWDPTRCRIVYKMKDINREFCVEDIKGKVYDDEEQKIDTSIDYSAEILKSMNEEVEKGRTEIIMETLYTAGITFEFLEKHGFTLPDGFHFIDRSGNTIDTTEIRLVKNSPYYPKSYEECCERLIQGSHYGVVNDILFGLEKKLEALKTLIVCRNAYWKIAGEYLELDKPWEPDWTNPNIDLYVIINSSYNEIYEGKYEPGSGRRILAFPTIEMQKAFLNNFKDLIEQCKELL
jgi:hypothetical protein